MIKGGQRLQQLSRRPAANDSPLKKAADETRNRLGVKLPTTALILGSGFQKVLQGTRIRAEFNIEEIAGFPAMRVKGHTGRILVAEIESLAVLVLSGRAHFYEGHSMDAVMFPVQLLAECGVRDLLLTNAAGGINPAFRPGDFMILSDHINMIGVNPLRGLPVEDGRCFVDLSDTYSTELRYRFHAAAKRESVTLHEGVYLGVCGPSYETPAEIRAFRMLGADAVGMSTIPEALMARYCGLNVAAISCITNCAAGLSSAKLSHSEVLAAGEANAANAARLLSGFAKASTGGAKA